MSKISKGQISVGATGFTSMFSMIGIMFYGMPFFYDFWVTQFGWTRVTVTSGNAIGRVTISLFAFFVGWLIDKYGPRILILIGVTCGSVAFIGFGQMNTIWQFYIFSLFAATGYICGGPLPNQVLITRWFDKARGKAMGIAYIGVGVGGMLVPQMASRLNARFGWQYAMVILGLLMIAVSFPVAWFAKDYPQEMESRHLWKNGKKDPERGKERPSLSKVLQSPYFYLLAIGSFCSISAVSGTSSHLKLFFSFDLNYTQAKSANILSLVLMSSIAGRFLMGWLADKIPKKFVMLLIYSLVSVSIILLHFTSIPWVIYLFAFVFGIALGGDYMIIPLMTAELFGQRILGRVMGIILTTDVIADSVSPVVIGAIRDNAISYMSSFNVLIILAALGALIILFLPSKSNVRE